MPSRWIVLVEGKEYGPVDLEALREWKEEGRVLPSNPARRADSDLWLKASDIAGLFESATVSPDRSAMQLAPVPRSLAQILGDTFRIYGRGFFQFLGLTLLVVVPSACAQLTSAALDMSKDVDMDLRTVLAGGFGFCMLMLTCAAWPIYIAGVQILTAELKTGRSPGFLTVLNEATKFWPRVAMLCILVYIAFGLLMMLAFAIAVMIVLGAASVLVIFIALVLLVFQVWMFGRFFINVLFWQQFAVLGQEEVVGALRQSKALARGRTELVWYKRPLWRGAFVVSLWGAFVLALNLPLLWPALRAYFHALSTSQDPQVIMQAVMASSKAEGANLAGIAIGLAQAVLRPLLGIAFVLLYLDATVAAREEDRRD